MRRQNRSCDQCRKAKRACNAPSLWDVHGRIKKRARPGIDVDDASSHITLTEQDLDEYETCASPCSHCLRTGKQCTLHWVRNQLRGSLTSNKPTATNDRRSPGKPPSIPWQSPPQSQARPGTGTGIEPETLPEPALEPSPPLVITAEDINSGSNSNSASVLELSWASSSSAGLTPPDLVDSYGVVPINTYEPGVVAATFDSESASYPIVSAKGGLPSDYDARSLHSQHGLATTAVGDINDVPLFQQQAGYVQTESPLPVSGGYQTDISLTLNSGYYPTKYSIENSLPSLSPFSASSMMATNTNKKLISDNLMRIYHDAFEFALTCCLSQEACPYNLTGVRQSAKSVSWLRARYDTVSLVSQYDPDQKETIIYHRVTKLDRAAQKCGLIRLTKSQDRAISKALYLSILAYATQWAQGSQRERQQYPPSTDNPHLDYVTDDVGTEFDRVLQKSLWTQAKRALDDCSDIECFRIVCADWIMGLTQRPMEKDDLDFDIPQSVFGSKPPIVGGRGSIASQVSDVIATAGPPIFTERAARKVHALKYRYETRRAGICEVEDNFCSLESDTFGALAENDINTFGLMYWMTIMIDTIASAMHNRPIVISDEECHHNPAYTSHTLSQGFDVDCQPQDLDWWARLFDGEIEKNCVLRWPCSSEAATKGIIASTPVKVILFRHVTALQSMVRSNCRGEIVENIITSAMAIYKHWRSTYGALFEGFIDEYDQVPLHMRVWFIHILVYFHYAALLLADLIELVDRKSLGLEYSSRIRLNVGAVGLLRSGSTNVISDLAGVATRPSPQTTEFHFAVVLQPILPEPWTMILIKSFTKVAILYLSEITKAVQHEPLSAGSPPVMMLVKKCEDCVKAVYCLGKKSDMAQAVCVILYSAIRPYLDG